MTVEGKVLFVEDKKTNEGKPFVIIHYQEMDDSGNTNSAPTSVLAFDEEVIKQCKTLVLENYYHLNLKVTKATLTGISCD